MNVNHLQKLKELLAKKPIISIIPHTKPDGDAIGSCLGLSLFLKHQGGQAKVISPTDYPDFLKWLPESEQVIIYPNNPEKAQEHIEKSELIFTLDFNSLNRAEPLASMLRASSATFVMIDHHQQPQTYAKFTFSNPEASSTCQMVYEFIEALGEKNAINQQMATCLLTGIITDTGSFQYSLTTPSTLKAAAFLMEKGANPTQITDLVFNSYSLNRLKLLGHTLDSLTFLPEYRTAYMAISSADLRKFNFQRGDTEGFVNYGLKIQQAELAVIFIQEEQEGFVKLSLRSKNNLDVNVFARTFFDGGGHINAAGGRVQGNVNQAIDYFLKVLPAFFALPNSRNNNYE